jgi:hypothetical protein
VLTSKGTPPFDISPPFPVAPTDSRRYTTFGVAVAAAVFVQGGTRPMIARPLILCLLTAALLAAPLPRASAAKPRNDQQVTLEVRFVTISDNCYKHLPHIKFLEDIQQAETAADCRFIRELTDLETFLFLEVVAAEKGTIVMQTPRMTTANDEAARLEVMDNRMFTTSVDLNWDGKCMVARPRKEAISTGLRLSAMPTVSPDRKTVLMNLEGALSSLESDPPVRSTVAISSESCGEVVIEKPVVNKLTVDTSFSVAEGKTALLGGWTRRHLSILPLSGRMKSAWKESKDHVLVLVTPHLVKDDRSTAEEEEEKSVLTPAPVKDDDPPDTAVVLKAMPPLPKAGPMLTVSREDVDIVTYLQSEESKVGCFGASYTERTWKCTVFFNEVIEGTFPFPFRCKKARVESLTLTTGDRGKMPGY